MVSVPAEEATMRRAASTMWKMALAILIASGTIAPPLHAQDGIGVDVAIPFAFSANGHDLPAGKYRLTIEDQFELSIRDLKTGPKRFFTTLPHSEPSSASSGRLVFDHCLSLCVLSEVHIPGTGTFSKVGQREQKQTRAPDRTKDDMRTIALR